MYQYKGLEDTIAAIATPAGQGGIGIIRMSGKDALSIADKVIRLKLGKTVASCKTHTVHLGHVLDQTSDDNVLDEVLVTLMRSPKSYTGEDVIEINCHGGMTVLTGVLGQVLRAGARHAEPGEFTKRAFLHGRMDLTQAEAVIDIIQAKTEMFLRQSQNQLKGVLSSQLEAIREASIKVYTMLEALINFPEDEINAETFQQIFNRINDEEKKIFKLLEGSKSGRILKEGIRIVLCGKPNVGKSSLLNALLKQERAIVTPIAGTTRDVLEEQAQMKGIPMALVDTAGILSPRDLIEEEAVKRSHLYIKSADLILLVLDHSRALEQEDRIVLDQLKGLKVLVVINKKDLDRKIDLTDPQIIFGEDHRIQVSVFDPSSIKDLESKIIDSISKDKDFDAHGILVSNIRHIKALETAQKNLQEAARLMADKTSLEFVSEEIKSAINQLDAITGRNIDQDLLDRIFSDFCIGK